METMELDGERDDDFCINKLEYMSLNIFDILKNPRSSRGVQSRISISSSKFKEKSIIEKFNKPCINDELNYTLVAACLIFLYRINNYQPLGVGFSYPQFNLESLPIHLMPNFQPDMTFADAVKLVKEKILKQKNNKRSLSIKKSFKIKIELTDNLNIDYPSNHQDIVFIIDRKTPNIMIKGNSDLLIFNANAPKYIKTLLSFGLENPHTHLSKLPLITEFERKAILKRWNNTHYQLTERKTITSLIEKNAIQNPRKIALIFNEKRITYGKLNQLSNRLANYLVNKGLKPGEFAAIFLDRSIEMIVAILAILKTGAAYVPIDIRYPCNRINYIINNSNSVMTISQRKILIKKSGFDQLKFSNLIEIDNEERLIKQYPMVLSKKSKKNTRNSNLAYLIYTSGSTGQPKGVLISHRNVLNYTDWFSKNFKLNECSTIDFSSSIGFDLSVACTLVPLIANAKIAICNEMTKLNPIQYVWHLAKNQVSHIECTPDYFSHLLVYPEQINKLNKLKWIMLGGDAVVKKDIEKWLKLRPNHNIVNEYGPTECTVAITSYLVTSENVQNYENTIPIGRPAFNTQVYILDQYHNLCPIGIPGELHIAGESVAVGYLCHEQTKQSFLPNPFSKRKGSKLYKTGDLVRWLADGNIEFLGRVDGQVKIRGFRIEPAEIENCLLNNSNIKQCKVLPKISASGEKILVAYLVISSQGNFSIDQLRKYLKECLPDYMIPSKFIIVEKFPTNSSGKIDIKKLYQIKGNSPKENTNIVKKLDIVTQNLIKIWSVLLNNEYIKPGDDFFALGGHSLSALKMLNEINNKFSIKLQIQVLFKNPTITRLAKAIRSLQKINSNIHETSEPNKAPQVICLQSISKKLPFFLIHPVGGTIFLYKDLVKYLGKQFSFYLLQDPGIENPSVTFNNLQEMASCYIARIQSVQPHGPYFLAGSSFGATLAVEIARQLSLLGEQIAFIGLLDGWANHSKKLCNKYFFQDIMRKKVIGLEPDYANALLNMQFSREELLFKYDIPKLSEPLVLFKAQKVWPIFRDIDSETNGWEKYSEKPIEVHVVPGDHETMFFEPHVKILAEKMKYSLKNIFY